jgi:hypothetical protein
VSGEARLPANEGCRCRRLSVLPRADALVLLVRCVAGCASHVNEPRDIGGSDSINRWGLSFVSTQRSWIVRYTYATLTHLALCSSSRSDMDIGRPPTRMSTGFAKRSDSPIERVWDGVQVQLAISEDLLIDSLRDERSVHVVHGPDSKT